MIPTRRGFLGSGAALTGSAIAVNRGHALRSGGPDGLLGPDQGVPDGATTTTVEPFERSYTGFQWATPETWVVHEFTWETVGDERPGHLRDIIDATTHRFEIDDDPIPSPNRYRSEIVETADGDYEVGWQIPIRPRAVGRHAFGVEIAFDTPIRSRKSASTTKVWDGTYEHRGEYDVYDLQDCPRDGDW